MVLNELWEVNPSYSELRSVIPGTACARNAFADYLVKKGEMPAALDEYASAYSLEPTLDSALLHLRKLCATRQYAAALAAGQQYLEKFGQEAALQGQLARVQIGLGKLPEAISIYESLYQKTPTDADICLALNRLLQATGRQHEAAQRLNECLSYRPGDARLHAALALTYEATEEPERALTALKQAVFLRPENTQYRFRLGETYRRQGLYQQALDQWNRCLRLDPQHGECQRARARVHKELGM
jgi:tetratricopeptide (TPR) repeat protein